MSLVEAYLRKKRGELLALRDKLYSVTLDEKTFHEFRHELERYRVSAPSAPRFEDFKGMKVIEYDGIRIQVASVFRKYGVVIWESEKSCGVDSLTSELFTMASKSYVDDINHKGVLEVGDAFIHSKTGQMFLVTEEGISMYSIAEGVKATTAIEDEWSTVEKLIEEEEKLKESEFLKELKEI